MGAAQTTSVSTNLSPYTYTYPSLSIHGASTQELIDEFKRRNLVDNKDLDRMLLDQNIENRQNSIKQLEKEIADLVAQKLKD